MNKKLDLTEGSILKKLMIIAIPIMGTQLMQMLYNLIDLFWLGRVGIDAVAAAGTAGMYMWLASGIMMIGHLGATIGVSQALGREDDDEAREYSNNALFVATVCGLICTMLLIIFREPLIGFFNIQEANVKADAIDYLTIIAFAIPSTFISSSLAGTFNSAGNSRIPFYIMAIGLTGNIILDPILIFSAGLGVVGAAVATIIAQISVSILFLIAMRMKKTCPLEDFSFIITPNVEKIKQIFRWTLPVCCEQLLFSLLSMITSRMISSYGAAAISVVKIGTQIEALSWMVGQGYASALTAFIGQNYGAKKWDRIIRGYKLSTISMAVWGIIVAFILFFAGGKMIYFLIPDPDSKELGIIFMQILALCQLSGTLEGVGAGIFRGIGKTIPGSITSVVSNASRVVLAYLLSLTPLGLSGIWLGTSIGATVRGLWIYLWSQRVIKNLEKNNAD